MVDGIINSLNDILIKMIDPAEGAFKTRSESTAIARMLAKVIDVKGDQALLRWAGGNFSAKVETPVFKGEHLLLEYHTQRGEKLCYRILARTETSMHRGTASNLPVTDSFLWSFLIPFGHQNYPVFIRYYQQQEKKNLSGQKKSPLLELIVETRNLGLVMVRIGIKKGGYDCIFLVESKEAGLRLEEEVRKLIEEEGRELAPGKELLSWSVYPVREEMAKEFAGGNVLLNARV
ncbi:MAG: hypothetical protein WAO23_05320 [Dethiobacteria bacterium]